VYLVRTPLFNASMAPNGMMQVWTGLMLRMENEAQLAAVLGHEIGHFLQRHGVERLRDVKSRLAFAQVLGVFGLVGAIGQIGVIASAYAYTRDQEREADSIGFELMRRSGYDVSQASRVWENLLAEIKARPDYDPVRSGPMLATHPAPDERRETLQKLAQANPGGAAGETEYASAMSAFQREWLREEVKRGQHEESIALLSRMAQLWPTRADLLWARGEVHRLRAANKDIDAALADFNAAIQLGNEPPETHRGLAYIYRARSQRPEALSEFQRYIELAPDAIDGNLIKNYIAELSL
jgi:predicted Zn-dependent protease